MNSLRALKTLVSLGAKILYQAAWLENHESQRKTLKQSGSPANASRVALSHRITSTF